MYIYNTCSIYIIFDFIKNKQLYLIVFHMEELISGMQKGLAFESIL